MTYVFVSYKREEVRAARQVRQALRAEGLDVWWDENLQGGQQWAAALDSALLNAAAVVVLWSRASVESDWVKHEASVARSAGRLLPVLLEPCKLPDALTSIQAVNLAGWTGSESDPRFVELARSARDRIRRQRRKRQSARLGWALLVVAAVVGGVAIGRTSAPRVQASASSLSDSAAKKAQVAAAAEDTPESQLAPAPALAQQGRERALANALITLVHAKEDTKAVELFPLLQEVGTTPAALTAYPAAVLAYDRLGNSQEAIRVVTLLKRWLLNKDNPSAILLRKDAVVPLRTILPQIRSESVRDDLKVLLQGLSKALSKPLKPPFEPTFGG